MQRLKLIMLGTGEPRPNLERSQSSQLLYINEEPILIDCGDGTTTQLLKAGVPLKEVKYLYFTHLHSDHTLGYGQFLLGGWGAGRSELTVVGPKGTKEFHEATLRMYKDDIDYRTSIGRPPEGVKNVKVIEVENGGEISNIPHAQVTATPVIHNVKTFAYRFQVANKAIVFSGDTSPTDKLIKLAEGADLIVHDAALVQPKQSNTPKWGKIWESIQKEHCTPGQAANTAREARAKKLVMTHFLEGINVEEVFKEATENFNGDVVVAEDLQVIDID